MTCISLIVFNIAATIIIFVGTYKIARLQNSIVEAKENVGVNSKGTQIDFELNADYDSVSTGVDGGVIQ